MRNKTSHMKVYLDVLMIVFNVTVYDFNTDKKLKRKSPTRTWFRWQGHEEEYIFLELAIHCTFTYLPCIYIQVSHDNTDMMVTVFITFEIE